MLQSELLNLISQGEGPKLEFKRDVGAPEALAKEIVAFANMNGGRILLGIEDKTQAIVGIEKKDLQAWLMDTVIGRYIRPFIPIDYEEATIEQKKVAIITIPQGSAKPYVRIHKKREDAYLRYGDTCQLATREQLIRLADLGGMVSTEKMPLHGSSIKDFESRRLQEYFVDIVEIIEKRKWENFSDDERLTWLLRRDFMRHINDQPEDQKAPVCTLWAMLLFGLEPHRWLPQCSFRLAVFSGTDKDYSTKLDVSIRSPFVGFGQSGASSYSEPSVPDRVMSYLESHISYKKLEGMNRKTFWDFPKEAIRELVLNAFAHRDWTKNTDVEISVYADRMEIISPGALPNGMTIEKLEAGQRAARNPLLVDVLRDYGLMEHQGMGIRRKVIPLMRERNGKEPEFEATEDYFKVTLRKASVRRV